MNKVKDRDNAIFLARIITSAPFVVLDSETTSLYEPEACSVGLVNESGEVFDRLVKPSKPIDAGATSVHGITNEMVANAPTLKEIEGDIYRFIRYQSPVVIYNAKFDMGVIKRSIPNFAFGVVYDAMKIYSEYVGYWDDYHGNYKWWKLGAACAACGLKLDEGSKLHGAAVDAEMTRRLLFYIAEQKLSTEA